MSRYNLFTPRSLVWLLEKMINEFGIERITRLLPTGGEGTLDDLYLAEREGSLQKPAPWGECCFPERDFDY
jgi:hypothetical protein